MPDPRSVMQEFRTLDAKRLAKGLSPEEERRLGELRDLVGNEAAGAPRGGFDVNAAAARLRESLLPAGLRNRPPPPPELSPEPEPEPFFPAPAPAALDDAPPAAPEAPLFADVDAAALFDPATLGWESEPAAAAQPPCEPAAPEAAAWDPNAGWDPNAASGQGWDPNALPGDAVAWEPAAAPVDASGQPWDPGALAADPNGQPWDPNALAADPNGQPWDPGALAADPNGQPWDPNALAVDPAGQEWDPNALARHPGSAASDPTAAGGWDPNAFADPASAASEGTQWDPGAPIFDPATLGVDAAGDPAACAYAGDGPQSAWDPGLLAAEDAAAADAATPPGAGWDPGFAAELEPEPTLALGAEAPFATPGELPAGDDDLTGTAPPLELDASVFELEPIEDAALVEEDGVAPQALASDPASAGWTVPALDAAIPDGYAFEDAAVAPEPTEMLGLASEPEPTQALSLLAADPAPLPPAGWDPSPAPAAAEPSAFGDYDELAAGGAELAPAVEGVEALEDFALGDPGLEPTLARDPSAPLIAPAPGDLGEYDDTAGFAPGVVFEPPPDGGFEAGAPLALGDDGASIDGAAAWPIGGAPEPSFELASGGSFDAAAEAASGWATAEAPAPWEPAPLHGALEPLSLDLPALALERELVTGDPPPASPSPQVAASGEEDLALPEIVEEIPTIDGEEILEEIPADEADFSPPTLDFGAAPVAPAPPSASPPVARPAAAAFAAPAAVAPPTPEASAVPMTPPCAAPASTSARAVAASRVVVHTLEGTVTRGVLESADLSAPTLALAPAPGEAAEPIATDRVKAIFFMLAPGEAPPAAEGKKVRVTFRDGRQVAGFSPDYREDGAGFFMIPGDTRTNTARIWVYRAAVKQVAVS